MFFYLLKICGEDKAYVPGKTSALNAIIDLVKGVYNKRKETDKYLLSGEYKPESAGHKRLMMGEEGGEKGEWKGRAENNSRDGAREMGLLDKLYIKFSYTERLQERK